MAKLNRQSWFDLTQDDVLGMVYVLVPEGSAVFEIGCGGRSAVAFGRMLRDGRIASYEGVNINQGGVDEARAEGLKAKLVDRDYEHTPVFAELSKRKGCVVMLGLPEVAPEAARMYAAKARLAGCEVVSYPPIKTY